MVVWLHRQRDSPVFSPGECRRELLLLQVLSSPAWMAVLPSSPAVSSSHGVVDAVDLTFTPFLSRMFQYMKFEFATSDKEKVIKH